MPDLYFYREPEDIEKEEQAAAAAAAKPEEPYPADWNAGATVTPAVEAQTSVSADWSEKPSAASADVSCFPLRVLKIRNCMYNGLRPNFLTTLMEGGGGGGEWCSTANFLFNI